MGPPLAPIQVELTVGPLTDSLTLSLPFEEGEWSAGMAGGAVADVLLSKDGSGHRRCRGDPLACFGIRNTFPTVVKRVSCYRLRRRDADAHHTFDAVRPLGGSVSGCARTAIAGRARAPA